MSTIIQPCNFSGLLHPEFLAKWGIVSVDWSNAHAVWSQSKPMNSDMMLLDQARQVKELNPETKMFVYRNIVKALPWFGMVRERMTDPAYSGWFLKYKDGVKGNYSAPACTVDQGCSPFYHDQLQTPQDAHSGFPPQKFGAWCNETCDCGTNPDGTKLPCGEYLFDHRNSSLGDWFVQEFLLGRLGLGSEYVDGYFLDDDWSPHGGWGCQRTSQYGGPTEVARGCIEDMGLTRTEIEEISAAWHQNYVTAKVILF